MYSNCEKDILDLYYQKKSLLDEIIKIMKDTVFYGNDSDAEKYINLVEKREEIIESIKDIDKKLNSLDNKNKFYSDELKILKNNISILVKSIIKLDENNNYIVEKIKNSLKKELKILSDSKSLNYVYNVENFNQEGHYFDIRN